MLATSAQAPATPSQPTRFARKGITILLVDDTDAVREVLRMVLTLEGYVVVTASDGPTALEIASRTHFDVLVTDFEMPGMNGFTLATSLTERRAALPVLVISGADPTALPLAEIERRNWNFLSKPLHNARMLEIIDGNCLGWALGNSGDSTHLPVSAEQEEGRAEVFAGIHELNRSDLNICEAAPTACRIPQHQASKVTSHGHLRAHRVLQVE